MEINAEIHGEPYIVHPLNVAYILADIGLDDDTICAALLHDVVEDTDVTNEDLQKEFGNEIAEMVAGVTKLGKMQFEKQSQFHPYHEHINLTLWSSHHHESTKYQVHFPAVLGASRHKFVILYHQDE